MENIFSLKPNNLLHEYNYKKNHTITILIVAITSLLNPLISFIIALYCFYRDGKNWRIYIFSFAMFFSSLSYCYMPIGTPDLVRYWDTVNQISAMKLSDVFFNNHLGNSSILYTFNLIAWLVGRIGDLHLLPAISTFVVYYIAFYVTCYVGNDLEKSQKYIFRYVVFIMCALNWYSIANNVRNVMAFSICGYAIFRDIYLKKRNFITVILYIIPIFLHPTAIVFIALRFCVGIVIKHKIIIAAAIPFSSALVSLIYNNLKSIKNYIINTVLYKAYYYFNDTTSEWAIAVHNSTFSTISKIHYLTFVAFYCIYFILNSKRNPLKKEYGNIFFQNFVFMIGLIALAFAPTWNPSYWRFYSAFVIFGGIIYLSYSEKILHKKLAFPIIVYSCYMCLMSLTITVYQMTIMVFEDIAFKMLTYCPMYVFLKDVINLI